MKRLQVFLVFAALLFAGVVTPPRARAEVDVSFDFFYDSLAPYGEWIEVGDYGLCWRPGNVDPDWEPYSDGYWAYTDAGWTWVSYEDFGAIVYHYGRWIRLEDDTWCWRPDYEWAPAWVAWRSNDDYVGWAPLPPEARWRRDVGISVWVDRDCDIGPGYYHFCHVRDFGAPVLRGVIINRQDNVAILRQTVNITNITYNTTYVGGPVIFNGGPRFDVINRFSARPVPALKLVQNANFDPARWRDHHAKGGRVPLQAQTVGNQLIVAAPVVRPPSDPSAFRSRVKVVVNADKISKGWGVVKNPEVQKELRQEINRQSKGLTPESAPARAVANTELKVVPAKADPHATPPVTATTNATVEPRDHGDRGGKGPRPGSNGVVSQPNNVPPTVSPATATTTTPEPHDRGGKGPRPGSGGVVVQPNHLPPDAPAVTTAPSNPPSSPDAGSHERGRGRGSPGSNPPTAGNPNLKPFNAPTDVPRQPQSPPPTTTSVPQTPTRGPKSADTNDAQRAADDARKRAEQDRMNPQRQAETTAQQQRQTEAAAQQKRQADAAQLQRQAEAAAQQKQRQADIAAQQQEAARSKAEDARRAADQKRSQQQQQMQIQQQQQQQQERQIQQQRSNDARRAQEAERDRQHQQQQQQQRPPQPQPQGNQPGNSPHPGGGHSKDGKDKDKDKGQ